MGGWSAMFGNAGGAPHGLEYLTLPLQGGRSLTERGCVLPHIPMIQRFCEDVCHHHLCGTVNDCDDSDAVGDGLMNEVKMEIDMPHPGMKLSVLQQSNGG